MIQRTGTSPFASKHFSFRPSACSVLVLLAAVACGGKRQVADPPVMTQSASDEILRVGEQWRAVLPEKGLLSPPSAISTFTNVRTSTVRLSEGSASEQLVVEEDISLRSGGTIRCRTVFEHSLGVRFGRKRGEAAVELVRPALQGARNCTAPHPEGALVESARRALFVLRADTLVALEPPLEKRKYIPGSF